MTPIGICFLGMVIICAIVAIIVIVAAFTSQGDSLEDRRESFPSSDIAFELEWKIQPLLPPLVHFKLIP